ncbi:hypothetical protein B0I37DRAFT_372440 [Chaetomium sp. MPI-CAGE-AT-0009]|nr:hypothetical protein B0I37DRAFT_372440 [Chaetomium sp. MPI-CAGE-AT-0009]
MAGAGPPVPRIYRFIGTGLGASMWFWIFYRAKKDGTADQPDKSLNRREAANPTSQGRFSSAGSTPGSTRCEIEEDRRWRDSYSGALYILPPIRRTPRAHLHNGVVCSTTITPLPICRLIRALGLSADSRYQHRWQLSG